MDKSVIYSQTPEQIYTDLAWAGIYTGSFGISIPNSTLSIEDKIRVLLRKQAEMTDALAPNNTIPSNNSQCN